MAFAACSVCEPAAAQTSGPAERAPTDAAVVGVVMDSSGVGLPGARVVLTRASDALLAGYTATDLDGAFRLSGVDAGAYVVQVSFVGFTTRRVPVQIAGSSVDIGSVVLAPMVGTLGELVVEGRQVPAVVRGDTLDYDALAFRVAPGSSAEELLRRLPGVEVAPDGTVRAQGEVVRRITVDGEAFFGDAPTVATRNVPADAVSRVEVFDDTGNLPDQVDLGGTDGVRTINLVLKDERRSGFFGTADVGIGASGGASPGARFDGRASAFRFGPTARLSVLASTNSVNRAALSPQEYIGLIGGPSALNLGSDGVARISGAVPIGAADGIAAVGLGGLSASRRVGAHTSLQAGYLGYGNDIRSERVLFRQQPAGLDSAFAETETSTGSARVLAHRLSATVDHDPSDGTSLRLRTGISLSDAGADEAASLERSLDATAQVGASEFVTAAKTTAADVLVTYRRRLAGRRSLAVNADARFEDTRSGDDLTTTEADDPFPAFVRRERERDTGTARVGATLAQSLGGRSALDLGLDVQAETAGQTLRTLDRAAQGEWSSGRTVRAARATAAVRTRYRGVQLRAGLTAEQSELETAGAAAAARRARPWLLPSASARTGSRSGRSAEISYTSALRQPSLYELDPTLDIRRPFDVYRGNPTLSPEVTHRLTASYRHFDAFSLASTSVSARASYTPTAISTVRTFGSGLVRTTQPASLGSAWTVSGSLSLSRSVGLLEGSVSMTASGDLRQGIARIDDAEGTYRTTRGAAAVEYQSVNPERLDARVGVRLDVSAASYAAAPNSGGTYGMWSPYATLGRPFGRGWTVGGQLSRDLALGGGAGLRRTPTLDATLTRSVRTARAQVVLANLLGQDTLVDYRSGVAFVEEERSRSLGRYLLARLSVSL